MKLFEQSRSEDACKIFGKEETKICLIAPKLKSHHCPQMKAYSWSKFQNDAEDGRDRIQHMGDKQRKTGKKVEYEL